MIVSFYIYCISHALPFFILHTVAIFSIILVVFVLSVFSVIPYTRLPF